MNSNDKYMLKHWVILIIACSFVLAMWVKDPKSIISVPILIVFVILRGKSIRASHIKQIELAYKEPTPEKLIKYYKKTLKKSVDDNSFAITAYSISMAHCFWGNFDIANEVMTAVNWEHKPDMFKIYPFLLKAIVIYLKEDNYLEGLRLVRKAKEYTTFTMKFPGRAKDENALSTYIEIGQILSGVCSYDIVSELDRKFNSSPYITIKLLTAWGLANAYKQLHNTEKEAEMLGFCRENAPYCKILHETK